MRPVTQSEQRHETHEGPHDIHPGRTVAAAFHCCYRALSCNSDIQKKEITSVKGYMTAADQYSAATCTCFWRKQNESLYCDTTQLTPLQKWMRSPQRLSNTQGIQRPEGIGPQSNGAALCPWLLAAFQHCHRNIHLLAEKYHITGTLSCKKVQASAARLLPTQLTLLGS